MKRHLKFRKMAMAISYFDPATDSTSETAIVGEQCDEFDSFADELVKLLRRHGVTFESSNLDYSMDVTIIPFDEQKTEEFFRILAWSYADELPIKTPNKGDGAVPWLDRAKKGFDKRCAMLIKKNDAARAAQARKEEGDENKKLIQEGLTIGGRRYKLIPSIRPSHKGMRK